MKLALRVSGLLALIALPALVGCHSNSMHAEKSGMMGSEGSMMSDNKSMMAKPAMDANHNADGSPKKYKVGSGLTYEG